MAGIKELSAQLQSLKKQMPFAAAQALTSVARQIAAAEKTAFQRKLENPTGFVELIELLAAMRIRSPHP